MHARIGRAFSPALLLIVVSSSRAQTGWVVGPQTRIDTAAAGRHCAETSVAASNHDPLRVVAAWNDQRINDGNTRIGIGFSLDGGVNWTDRVVEAPAPHTQRNHGEPMSAYDHSTGNLWVGGIADADSGSPYSSPFVKRLSPTGTDFESAVIAGNFTTLIDRTQMAAGPTPGVPLGPTRLYVILKAETAPSSQVFDFWLIRSTDSLGNTWEAPRNLNNLLGEAQGSIHHTVMPRVGPAGDLYLCYDRAFGSTFDIRFARSTDGGNTFLAPITLANRNDTCTDRGCIGRAGNSVTAFYACVAAKPTSGSGTVYVVWSDVAGQVNNGCGLQPDLNLYFTKSTAFGAAGTWTTPVQLLDSAGIRAAGDQFFPWLEVDSAGRLQLVYYDCYLDRQGLTQCDGAAGYYNTYWARSTNGGNTWTTQLLTTIDAPWGAYDSYFFDYIGLAVGGDHIYPCYTATTNYNGDFDPNIYVNVIKPPDTNRPTP